MREKGGLDVRCTCVASDILQPISKLTPDQVTYHIIAGYTAKVAGTEEGVKVTVLTDTLSKLSWSGVVLEALTMTSSTC